MATDWIIDVLTDLKAFASENGLPALAGELDDAVLVAAAEIASSDAEAGTPASGQGLTGWEVEQTRAIGRRAAAS